MSSPLKKGVELCSYAAKKMKFLIRKRPDYLSCKGLIISSLMILSYREENKFRISASSRNSKFNQCVILFEILNFEFLEEALIRNLFSSLFNQCFVRKKDFDIIIRRLKRR